MAAATNPAARRRRRARRLGVDPLMMRSRLSSALLSVSSSRASVVRSENVSASRTMNDVSRIPCPPSRLGPRAAPTAGPLSGTLALATSESERRSAVARRPPLGGSSGAVPAAVLVEGADVGAASQDVGEGRISTGVDGVGPGVTVRAKRSSYAVLSGSRQAPQRSVRTHAPRGRGARTHRPRRIHPPGRPPALDRREDGGDAYRRFVGFVG